MSKERCRPITLKETVLKSTVRVLLTLVATGAMTYDHVIRPLDEKTCTLDNSPLSSEVINLVIEDLKELGDADCALLFFPGGEGRTKLDDDPGFQEITDQITELLKERGYNPKVLEFSRQESPFEIIDQTQPSSVAKKNALRIGLLSALRPDLVFFIMGRSNAVPSIEETKCCLFNQNTAIAEKIFSLELGWPFGKNKEPKNPERTLIWANEKDYLAQGDLVSLVKENLQPSLSWHGEGDVSLGPLRIEFDDPNHDYTWKMICEMATEFVEKHFPDRS